MISGQTYFILVGVIALNLGMCLGVPVIDVIGIRKDLF